MGYQQKEYIQRWQTGLESGMSGDYQISKRIRRYMLEKTHNQCEICGWNKVNVFTNQVPLEIHHIDGNYTNNKEDNLQVLCPNCHSLTENYKGLNTGQGRAGRIKYTPKKKYYCIDCGKEVSKIGALRCSECNRKAQRVVERPSREELKNMIRIIPFTKIAEQYHVSDKAITKWCISENLPSRKKDIKIISDEEWKKI
jgi:DNA-directed RNA polymerase subunit RPC12/RpoP